MSVRIDTGGNVVAAGFTTNTRTGNDFTVVKLSGASGGEIWRRTLDNGASTDQANSVALDPADNIASTGPSPKARRQHERWLGLQAAL